MLKIASVKKVYLFLGLAIAAIVLHNVFYGLFKVEEPVFFTLALASISAFVLSVVWVTLGYLKTKEPKDLWKLSWLGFLGLFGLLPGSNLGFLGFFGFFGFLGMRRNTGA